MSTKNSTQGSVNIISAHWRNEALIEPPQAFVEQANVKTSALHERMTEEHSRSASTNMRACSIGRGTGSVHSTIRAHYFSAGLWGAHSMPVSIAWIGTCPRWRSKRPTISYPKTKMSLPSRSATGRYIGG